MNNKSGEHWAQSCITSIGFPGTIHGVIDMLDGNAYKGLNLTDIDCLLRFQPDDDTFWTAPKWMTADDVLFFYHTKRGGFNASRLRNLARKNHPKDTALLSVLDHAADLAERFAGSIFGCASISGSAEYFGRPEKHLNGRLFAPLSKVHIFDTPLKSEYFAEFIKIGQSTITPVYAREAEGIRSMLAKDNVVPRFLSEVRFGDNTFRNVTKDNWADISCLPETRFIHEAQLRSYMLDFFLSGIKDKGSTLLEECQCFRKGASTGIVDNFVRIAGRWVPCEAKLSILSEKDIMAQASRYMNIDSFVPTKGPRRGNEHVVERSDLCIVVDQTGLYLISSDLQFIGCDYDSPIWRREQLGKVSSEMVAELLQVSG